MRIRSIKPEFWKSDDIAALDWPARLIFIGLWSYVDDNGVGRDNERLIRAELFPQDTDDGVPDALHRALDALATASHITRYTVDGRPFLHITTWDKHQKIDRPAKGRYPLPTSENAEIRCNASSPRRDASPGAVEQRNRGTGEEETRPPASPSGTADPPGFTEFWFTWPGSQSKADAKKAYAKALKKRTPAQLLEAATRFRDDPNRTNRNTPYAPTWLNGERWEDGPLPNLLGSNRPNQTQVATGWMQAGANLMDLYPDETKEISG